MINISVISCRCQYSVLLLVVTCLSQLLFMHSSVKCDRSCDKVSCVIVTVCSKISRFYLSVWLSRIGHTVGLSSQRFKNCHPTPCKRKVVCMVACMSVNNQTNWTPLICELIIIYLLSCHSCEWCGMSFSWFAGFIWCIVLLSCTPSPLIDNIWAMMLVLR